MLTLLTSQEYRPDTTVSNLSTVTGCFIQATAALEDLLEGLQKLALAGRLIPQGNKLWYIRKVDGLSSLSD